MSDKCDEVNLLFRQKNGPEESQKYVRGGTRNVNRRNMERDLG